MEIANGCNKIHVALFLSCVDLMIKNPKNIEECLTEKMLGEL